MRIRATAAGLVLALASVALPSAASVPKKSSAKAAEPIVEAPEEEPLPENMAQIVNWVMASGDNNGLPFMVIDKVGAEVIVFDGEGQRRGATAALFGSTPGDDSSPGVGDRELSDISPEERTTPAGRFVAKFGRASGNRKVLWVDYHTSISLHPVITTNKKERRAQRLKSATPEDNRITFGCINVPPRFYTRVVVPNFKKGIGLVYILPEIKTLNEAFPTYQAQRQWTTR